MRSSSLGSVDPIKARSTARCRRSMAIWVEGAGVLGGHVDQRGLRGEHPLDVV
jgi:hypothetical protein